MPSAVVGPPTHDDGTAAAQACGAHDLVLLTSTADGWFPRFGFERISRDAAPASLHASEEFRGACPASAVVMRLRF